MKANFPDFKHKDTGVGLWLDSAPAEVLQGLGQLEFYNGGCFFNLDFLKAYKYLPMILTLIIYNWML